VQPYDVISSTAIELNFSETLLLDLVLRLLLSCGMTLLLRKQRAQARIEGREPFDWPDDDYAVVADTIVGRIYREMIIGKPKWRWFLQCIPQGRSGKADSAAQSGNCRHAGGSAGSVQKAL
jgi:hypothetical protein